MGDLAARAFQANDIAAAEDPVRRERCDVLGSRIDVVGWTEAVDRIAGWAKLRQSRLVVICNVHSVVSAMRNLHFAAIIERADLVTPDGWPIAWRLRRNGHKSQERIDGPGLMLLCCERAAAEGIPIFLMGSTPPTLARLQERLLKDYPGLQIAGAVSPPFFDNPEMRQESAMVEQIRRSGAGILFVGLGCPKQEHWMSRNAASLGMVMLGVGAAFDFHAGIIRRAPTWMRSRGLEWLHRLAQDPRRLWRRYLLTNSRFLYELIQRRLQRFRGHSDSVTASGRSGR